MFPGLFSSPAAQATPTPEADDDSEIDALDHVARLMDDFLWGYLEPINPGLVRIDFWRCIRTYEIGRDVQANRIVLPGMNISNEHAVISWNGHIDENDSSVVIKDLSRNGTFVNDTLVDRQTGWRLKEGDKIYFGAPEPVLYEGGRFDYRYIYHDITYPVPSALHTYYALSNQSLGAGTFGTVQKGVEKATGRVVAIKGIVYEPVPGECRTKDNDVCEFSPEKSQRYLNHLESISREIVSMKTIKHPHVMELYRAYADHMNLTIYLIMEYMPNGDLNSYNHRHGPLPEDSVRDIMYQICQAMSYMHDKGLVHRDLKPENILLAGTHPPFIKIADFGAARRESAGKPMRTRCGTPLYMAPEITCPGPDGHDSRVDCWSVGMIMFYLLINESPYDTGLPFRQHGLARLCWEKLTVDNPIKGTKKASFTAQHFCKSLLEFEPSDRYSLAAALDDPWLNFHVPLIQGIVYPSATEEAMLERMRLAEEASTV
ncbi:kinase-like domain-containing protein [Mycena rebaudengoi]|nr:kinase-like domain-containing protein [Mycena rebaudengoi]